MGVSNIMLQAGAMPEVVDSIVNNIGIDMFDEEIDDVIFQTNEFLTDASVAWPWERCLPSSWRRAWRIR